jgi:hypothetical protein
VYCRPLLPSGLYLPDAYKRSKLLSPVMSPDIAYCVPGGKSDPHGGPVS